jgi:hypothetical protein
MENVELEWKTIMLDKLQLQKMIYTTAIVSHRIFYIIKKSVLECRQDGELLTSL